MAEVTVVQSNKRQISSGQTKYGFKIDHPNLSGEWINVVDWDNVHKGKEFSKGDTIHITKPEKDEYGWQAKFEERSRGYNEEEQAQHNESVMKSEVSLILNYVKQLAAKQDITLETPSAEADSPDYPEPTQGQTEQGIEEAFEEYSQEEKDAIDQW